MRVRCVPFLFPLCFVFGLHLVGVWGGQVWVVGGIECADQASLPLPASFDSVVPSTLPPPIISSLHTPSGPSPSCPYPSKRPGAGSTDSSPSATELPDLRDPTRPADWDTRPSRATSSTESESDEETGKSPSRRGAFSSYIWRRVARGWRVCGGRSGQTEQRERNCEDKGKRLTHRSCFILTELPSVSPFDTESTTCTSLFPSPHASGGGLGLNPSPFV